MSRLIMVLLALCGASCSNFEREWAAHRKEANAPVAARWVGTWKSSANGHSGSLRCLVRPPEQPGGNYHFRYHATWGKVLNGTFDIVCSLEPKRAGVWKVFGEKDLGRVFGGIFSHEGEINGAAFNATYRSKFDQGAFTLRRAD